MGGEDYVSLAASKLPEGNIDPASVRIELATECHGIASTSATAVSIVSGSSGSELISFLLPSGLDRGQYYISISDYAEGDANFESSNCAVVNVVN
jgi:hypothetical protein